MYRPHYNALQTFLEDHLNTIQRPLEMDRRQWSVDEYKEQYDRYDEIKDRDFPSVYYELIQPVTWTTDNMKKKTAQAEICLHLVDKDIDDNSVSILQMADFLLYGVEGKVIEDTQAKCVFFRSIRMVTSELKTITNNIHVFKITFSTEMNMTVNGRKFQFVQPETQVDGSEYN